MNPLLRGSALARGRIPATTVQASSKRFISTSRPTNNIPGEQTWRTFGGVTKRIIDQPDRVRQNQEHFSRPDKPTYLKGSVDEQMQIGLWAMALGLFGYAMVALLNDLRLGKNKKGVE